MSGILTRKYSAFPVQPLIIRNEGEQIVTRHNTEYMSLAERRTWTIPPDDLPADAVIDSGRRQDWEVQHSVTMDSMYNQMTTILPINTKFVKGL